MRSVPLVCPHCGGSLSVCTEPVAEPAGIFAGVLEVETCGAVYCGRCRLVVSGDNDRCPLNRVGCLASK